jgi:hypothetical protein
MIRRKHAAVILYKLVPLLILHLSTLLLGRYSLPFRLRPSALCAALMFVNPSPVIFRGFLSRTVPLAGREIRCLLPRPRSSQRTPINCSFRAVPYVLRARKLLTQQPEPGYSSKCQKKVRVLSFLKGNCDSRPRYPRNSPPLPVKLGHALSLLIHRKSRMRQRACTDLCAGLSAMIVPTATKWFLFPKTGASR